MNDPNRAIAVVGIGCRYPDACGPRELWENVLAQRRAFRRIPAERLRLEDYFSDNGAPDSIYSTEAAVLEGYEFDRARFRIGERAFRSADLAHWLALDVASQALVDAGFPGGEGLDGDAVGVLVGNTLTGEFSRAASLRLRWPYLRRQVAAVLAEDGWDAGRRLAFLERLEKVWKEPFPESTEETLAGGLSNTIAGRICNHFDFHGGGYTVDGACASSLLAVANACSSLAAGDLEIALVGGVDLSLDPFELVGFARTQALTAGEMRVFDRRSAGFIPGEGCGFIVLMPYRAARERGLGIYATVRGWGISSDGRGGLTRPEVGGQLLALGRAYRRAGFGIGEVALLEGHGTGTTVGDATELATLNRARRQDGARERAAVGSIKANIGHTKAAAGVAGLIKAALALQHRLLPPTTGCEDPHPEITADGSTLRTLERPGPWDGGSGPEDRPLRAGVSAMGFGGINCHLALESVPPDGGRAGLTSGVPAWMPAPQDAEVVFLTGADQAALRQQVEGLSRLATRLSRAEITDLAAEMASRAAPDAALRAAVVASTPAELRDRLDHLAAGLAQALDGPWLDLEAGVFAGPVRRPPRVGFLFPGQGSPSHLDGGLWRRRFAGVERLYREARLPADGDASETAVAQPAIATAALAALAALGRLGIEGTVAVGHSLGELVALHWAGAWDGAALLRLAAARGRAMSELAKAGRSTMASVGAGDGEVADLIASLGVETLRITGYNSPAQTVISGSIEEVEAAVSGARATGWKAHRLDVSHAFHSPFVAAAVPRLREALARETAGSLRRRVVSTIRGEALPQDTDLKALLCRQITEPVRFTRALAAAATEVDVFLEVGPGEVLSGLARSQITAPAIPLDAGGASLRGLLRAAGALFVLGAPVDLRALFADRFTRRFDPEREPRFLANPCELAPLEGAAAPIAAIETPAASRETADPGRTPLVPPAASPLELVRELIAERAELPVDVINDESRLLSDLHLNSIAVGELVTEAARRLDRPPPFAPTEYADASVLEVARALEEMAGGSAVDPESGAPEAEASRTGTRRPLPPGVDAWTRTFTVEWVERRLPRVAARRPEDRRWRVLSSPGHPLGAALEAMAQTAGGTVLCLPSGAADPGVLLAAGKTVLAERDGPLVLVQPGAAAAPFVRTLHLEAPDVPVAVVDVPADCGEEPETWSRRVLAEALAVRRYSEARYDGDGGRFQPVLRLLPGGPAPADPGTPALVEDDVLLVSGGGKGIAAECAVALARRTGARLALLGRSNPDADPELRANLERFEASGVRFLYLPADVTDAGAVRAAVARVTEELGEVRGVLHGAGSNTPRLVAGLEREAFERTLAPKARGLRNLLAAVDGRRLKLLVGFGSIIARTGLRGEADYAVANDELRREIEGFAGEHPGCRSLCVDWSVWSGVGMGERLGRLEALAAQGIMPISPDQGIATLQELVLGPRPPVSVVVAGRFGEPPTLEVERPELPLRRFLEKPRVYFPSVELVVDCKLSRDTDPYLEEHVFRGQRLFPAVLGLEAMAQVAAALTASKRPPVFRDVRFERPISVPAAGATTLRLAALVRRSGEVEIALRSDVTGFQVDHFRASCLPSGDAGDQAAAATDGAAEVETLLPLAHADLYGPVLFQQGRFQRVTGYRELEATRCLAEVEPRPERDWFGPYLSADLQLGDPGSRDAFIHCIQSCIPHATVLPVAVERLVAGEIAAPGPYRVSARERERRGQTLVYDLEARAPDGRVVESWQGLELRIVDAGAAPAELALPLLGPYLERRLQDLVPDARLSVRVARNGICEGEVAVLHRPDGKPERIDGLGVSVAHAGDLVLEVVGSGQVGCDLEPVERRPAELWKDLLGPRSELVEHLLHEQGGEDRDAASTRVWSAVESLRKVGRFADAPLTFADATEDGWVLFASGRHTAATVLLAPHGSGPLSFALLAEKPRPPVAS